MPEPTSARDRAEPHGHRDGVQVVGAILTGSLALLADAAHMFTDAAALVVALIATAIAARPADDRRTFGYQRAEVLGALVNGIVLIV